MGVKFGMEESTSPNFIPRWCRGGVWAPKTKSLSDFYKISEYKRLAEMHPSHNFYKIIRSAVTILKIKITFLTGVNGINWIVMLYLLQLKVVIATVSGQRNLMLRWLLALGFYMQVASVQRHWLCVMACARERYLKTWVPPVPESSQLSDADITQFVTGMTTVTSLAMFNKTGSSDSSAAMQYLAMLRPEIIVPPILDVYVC